jgi:phosphoribosylformimino-5-aminoimidazole carboxamide ribotide isomerase
MAEAFTLFPAIDLRAGQVVRLAQGDPARQTSYGAEPAEVARRWCGAGAKWVHVVNLDGAFSRDGAAGQAPAEANLAALSAIATVPGLRVQFGGGLRDQAGVRRAFELGAARVVLGTAALESPALVGWALRTYGPERVAAGLDARDGQVRVRGWAEPAPLSAGVLGAQLRRLGLDWCIFTDIARDGVSAGVNVPATVALAQATGLRVVASGGVAGLEDVLAVRAAGLAGVIVGRALYEGQVDLAQALAAC